MMYRANCSSWHSSSRWCFQWERCGDNSYVCLWWSAVWSCDTTSHRFIRYTHTIML